MPAPVLGTVVTLENKNETAVSTDFNSSGSEEMSNSKNTWIRNEGSHILVATGNGTKESRVDNVSYFKTLTKDALFLTNPWWLQKGQPCLILCHGTKRGQFRAR